MTNKRKRTIIVVNIFIVIAIVLGLLLFIQPLSNNGMSEPETTTEQPTSQENPPTFDELKRAHGDRLIDHGKSQITTVLFQDKNLAIITTADGKEIQLPLVVTDKANNRFKIPSLMYANSHLKIGDTFNLAQAEDKYYAYQL